ncbi:MAG TPA: Rieske 2Fe-2S domain-containing protein [Thermodesulfobacteriota bacterium]
MPETAVDLVKRQTWLDSVASGLGSAVDTALGAAGPARKPVENVLNGVWLGHPLHPVLVTIPIGSWSLAAVLDGLEAASGRRDLGPAADLAVGVGVIGAVASAVAGAADWQHTSGDTRRIGAMHALLNAGAAALYTTSWLLRRRGKRSAGRGLASIGFAVANASAYLGGHLVYGERIGVTHAVAPPEPRDFVDVLAEADLADRTPRRVTVAGQPVVLVRDGGRIDALAEVCSHLGGPLAEGAVEDGSIRCPWHGSRFALEDGRVLDGPATLPQPRYEARVREGRVEVRRAPWGP